MDQMNETVKRPNVHPVDFYARTETVYHLDWFVMERQIVQVIIWTLYKGVFIKEQINKWKLN